MPLTVEHVSVTSRDAAAPAVSARDGSRVVVVLADEPATED